jgi:predicted small metal-binding protein
VPVDHEVGEEQPTLAPGQHSVEPLPVTLDGQRAADLDAQRQRVRRRLHAHILALRWKSGQSGGTTMKIIRCECGYVARGESDEQVVEQIRGHMASDHPALLKTVSSADLRNWVQAE